jgi:hypothetical protein
VLPAPQEATASPDAARVEPPVITSPEHCDQNVTCRSSLGQIGNELSTGANHPSLNRIATVRTTIMRRLRKPTGGPEFCWQPRVRRVRTAAANPSTAASPVFWPGLGGCG